MADHHKAQNARQTNEAAHQRRGVEPVHQEWTRLEQTDQATLQRALANPGMARPADILALQRAYGNQAVSRLIQAKLKVGPMGDHYEQEADRVAEQVMSMPNPQAVSSQQSAVGAQSPLQRQAPEEEEQVQTKPVAASITPLVQRQAKPLVQRQAEEEEEELQTKPLVQRQAEEEEEKLQTKPLVQRRADGGFEAGSELEHRLAAHKGAGSPLPEDVRAYMEPRFGADFSGVRVHTGGEAVQMNRELNAQAFTHSQDIYLGTGRYDPGSDMGKRLLAHELTHVIQQSGGGQLHRQPERSDHSKPVPPVQRRASTGTVQRILGPGRPKDAQVVFHTESQDQEGYKVLRYNERIQKYTLQYEQTDKIIPNITANDIRWGPATPDSDREASRTRWLAERSTTAVNYGELVTPLDYKKDDFRYWFYYMLQQLPNNERKTDYLKKTFNPTLERTVKADLNDAQKKKLLTEMFAEGFRSYEQLAIDQQKDLIKAGAALANPIVGTGIGYGFRGDSRDPGKMKSLGGFTTKVESKEEEFRNRYGLNADWNPFKVPGDLPGQNPSKNAGYWRNEDKDNDLTTIISVAHNFLEASKFPMIQDGEVPVQETTYQNQLKQKSTTYVYLVIVEDGFDTMAAQAANSFPEIATRTIPWANVLAVYEVERIHYGNHANDGHLMSVNSFRILDGARDRYSNTPGWTGMVQTAEAYSTIKSLSYRTAGQEKLPDQLYFKVSYRTHWGENVFVVGNIPGLGSWNPSDAKPLRYVDQNTWEGEVRFPNAKVDTRIEYKYMVKEGANIRWEGGANHIYELSVRSKDSAPDKWHE